MWLSKPASDISKNYPQSPKFAHCSLQLFVVQDKLTQLPPTLNFVRSEVAHLMLSCSFRPPSWPCTEIPSSPTACMDWLPLRTTSRGDMGDPSFHMRQEATSAVAASGCQSTQRACSHQYWPLLLTIDTEHCIQVWNEEKRTEQKPNTQHKGVSLQKKCKGP